MRKRLVEKFEKDWIDTKNIKPIAIKLTESTRLVEANGNIYNCLSCYKIPVWKLDEKNLNGRVYPRSLAEKIVRENKVTVALDGHPEDDNYVPLLKDVIAIGKNPSIEENILWVYCYFVDEEYDKKAHRIMDLGFPLQQSSSGLGEVDAYDTVIAETYELERYFDLLVQDSSYQVFTSKDNEVVDVSVQKIEKQKESSSLTEQVTIINRNTSLDENKKDTSMDKSLKLNVKSLIREAESKDNLAEKNRLLKEAFNAVKDEESFVDLKKVITEKIRSNDIEITKLANKGMKADELNSKLKESVSKLSEAEKVIKQLKEEKATLVKAVKESATSLKKVKESAKEKIETFEDISKKNKASFTKVKESAKKNGILLKKSVTAINAIREKFNAVEFRNDALTRKVARLIKENRELVYKLSKVKEEEEDTLVQDRRRSRYSSPMVARRNLRKTRRYNEPEEEFTEEEDDEDTTVVSRNRRRNSAPISRRRRNFRRNYETPEVIEEEDDVADEFSQTQEVKNYYNDTVKNKPFLESHKKTILGSKTVEDAMFKVMQIEAQETDNAQFKLNMMNEKVVKINDGKDIQHNLEVGLLNKRKGWV